MKDSFTTIARCGVQDSAGGSAMRLEHTTFPLSPVLRTPAEAHQLSSALLRIDGVSRAYVNLATEMVYVEYDPGRCGANTLHRLAASVPLVTPVDGRSRRQPRGARPLDGTPAACARQGRIRRRVRITALASALLLVLSVLGTAAAASTGTRWLELLLITATLAGVVALSRVAVRARSSALRSGTAPATNGSCDPGVPRHG